MPGVASDGGRPERTIEGRALRVRAPGPIVRGRPQPADEKRLRRRAAPGDWDELRRSYGVPARTPSGHAPIYE
jgi:hypothetical protein